MSHRKKYIPKKGISTRLAHRRSVAANVNAKVRENTGAAIRMETTTSVGGDTGDSYCFQLPSFIC